MNLSLARLPISRKCFSTSLPAQCITCTKSFVSRSCASGSAAFAHNLNENIQDKTVYKRVWTAEVATESEANVSVRCPSGRRSVEIFRPCLSEN